MKAREMGSPRGKYGARVDRKDFEKNKGDKNRRITDLAERLGLSGHPLVTEILEKDFDFDKDFSPEKKYTDRLFFCVAKAIDALNNLGVENSRTVYEWAGRRMNNSLFSRLEFDFLVSVALAGEQGKDRCAEWISSQRVSGTGKTSFQSFNYEGWLLEILAMSKNLEKVKILLEWEKRNGNPPKKYDSFADWLDFLKRQEEESKPIKTPADFVFNGMKERVGPEMVFKFLATFDRFNEWQKAIGISRWGLNELKISVSSGGFPRGFAYKMAEIIVPFFDCLRDVEGAREVFNKNAKEFFADDVVVRLQEECELIIQMTRTVFALMDELKKPDNKNISGFFAKNSEIREKQSRDALNVLDGVGQSAKVRKMDAKSEIVDGKKYVVELVCRVRGRSEIHLKVFDISTGRFYFDIYEPELRQAGWQSKVPEDLNRELLNDLWLHACAITDKKSQLLMDVKDDRSVFRIYAMICFLRFVFADLESRIRAWKKEVEDARRQDLPIDVK